MSSFHYRMQQELPENGSLSDEKEQLLERVQAYEKLGMHKEAIDECRNLIRHDPDDPASLVELGVQFELKGEKKKASKYFKYAMRKFPQYFRSYIGLGYWFERYRERRDMAMLCYEKALELNPDDEWAFYNIGRMLHYSGKWQEAIPFYEQSYEACKRGGVVVGRTLHGLGWAYYRLKDYKSALLMFQRIPSEQPGYLEEKNDVWADFGCVLYRMGLYDKALALLREAVLRQPDIKRYQRLRKLLGEKV